MVMAKLPVLSPRNHRRKFYVVIPGWKSMTPAEREQEAKDAVWPVRIREYLPEHLDFIQYLLERSLAKWSR